MPDMQLRRRSALVAAVTMAAVLRPSPARAGAQAEEPLADAVRTALSAAVDPWVTVVSVLWGCGRCGARLQ